MSDRIQAFDFTRVVCTFGIILFHFSGNTASEFKPFYIFPNGVWGDVFVGIFFILSGGLLYMNNRKSSLLTFYYKRWKSIFPGFYLAYLFCFAATMFRIPGSLIKPLPHYIPTLLGMDGLINTFGLNAYFPTVYLIGEWFLGAIIICYLFMPAFIRISKKADLLLLAVVFVLAHVIKISYVSSVCQWLFYMQTGIVFMKRDLWKNSYVFLVSLIVTFFLSYVPAWGHPYLREAVLAAALFVVLSYLGQYIMTDGFLNPWFLKLSTWSFSIFLLHHFIIDNVFYQANSVYPERAFLELMFILAASVAGGFILNTLTGRILKSKGFKSLEKKLIR